MSKTLMKTGLLGLAAALIACGPPTNPDNGQPDGSVDNACTGQGTRCNGYTYQRCENGQFVDVSTCTAVCDPGLGCVECLPQYGTACQGDVVYTCNPDGSLGGMVETCQAGQCSNGGCADNGCSAAAELVYVVDQDYRLLSFDPRKLSLGQDPFTLIGNLSCPAGAPWPDWGGGGAATPFSMSVDRDARAWVLYTSGEIFHVSTQNASCQASGFSRGQQGFELFGMGFVTDAAGGSTERLWIAGGAAQNAGQRIGDLAYIDPDTMQVTRIGTLPGGAQYSPELTGTGDAELFGYYPGSYVALINKNNASHQQQWNLPGLGTVRAWAFAHWGGDFYIFVTEEDFFGNRYNRVQFLDRQTGQLTTPLDDHAYTIVGAGVSTCAPVVVE